MPGFKAAAARPDATGVRCNTASTGNADDLHPPLYSPLKLPPGEISSAASLEISLYAKTRIAFFGERGAQAQMLRGSAVKDDRRGGAPGLHKRGTSAEDRGGSRAGRVAPILDGTGDSPPAFRTRGREGGVAVRRTGAIAQPGSTRSPGWRRASISNSSSRTCNERNPVSSFSAIAALTTRGILPLVLLIR